MRKSRRFWQSVLVVCLAVMLRMHTNISMPTRPLHCCCTFLLTDLWF